MWLATFFLLAVAAQGAYPAQFITADYAENIDDKEAWQARIVSGWEAKPGQHPHQVSLRMVDVHGAVGGCGGNVVHKEWVITSAHCTASRITIVVRAGLVHMTRPEMMLETTEYYNYPTFDSSIADRVQPNDIALVKLQQPLQYSRNLRSIRIQPSSDAYRNYDEEIVIASGFGRIWTLGALPQELRWVYLRGVSNAACTSIFGNVVVTENTVCARFFNVTSQSICQGDSGGPLVHVSPEGVPFLIGVSSFVAGGSFGCHSGLPGAFIRPGPFHSWFTEITGIDFNNLNEEEGEDTTVVPSTYPDTSPTDLPTTTTTPIPETTTSTDSPTTEYFPTTSTTNAPTTTTDRPTTITTTDRPTTITTTDRPTTITTTDRPTTITTTEGPTTTNEPESEEDESEEIDDPELEDLLKRLEVKIKVKVKLSKYLKKKKQQEIE